MIVVRPGIKHDFDRDALHDLHIVASRIFRGQQAEARAAGARRRCRPCPCICARWRRLRCVTRCPAFISRKLRFLEVGGNPDVVEIDDLHQLLPGSDILPDLDGAIADDAVDRSNDFGVLQVQLRLIESRFLALRLRQAPTRPWRAMICICLGAVWAYR